MEESPKKERLSDRYLGQYDSYMRDVHKYLGEVRQNKRRFTPQAAWKPRFSEARDQGFFKNPPTDKAYTQGHREPSKLESTGSSIRKKLQGAFKEEGPWDAVLRPNSELGQKFYGFGKEVGRALGDPRLEAITGGAGALARAPGALAREGKALWGAVNNERGIFKFPSKQPGKDIFGYDTGGSNRPLKELQQFDKEMATPDYKDYVFGRKADQKVAIERMQGEDSVFKKLGPEGRARVNASQEGEAQLRGEINKAKHVPELGGGKPPEAWKPEVWTETWKRKK